MFLNIAASQTLQFQMEHATKLEYKKKGQQYFLICNCHASNFFFTLLIGKAYWCWEGERKEAGYDCKYYSMLKGDIIST